LAEKKELKYPESSNDLKKLDHRFFTKPQLHQVPILPLNLAFELNVDAKVVKNAEKGSKQLPDYI
jgi:hypothetical protein